MKLLKKVALSGILGVIIGYILCAALLFVFQSNFIYMQVADTRTTCAVPNGGTLLDIGGAPAIYIERSETLVVYYTGKGETICGESWIEPHSASQNYSTLLVTYPGVFAGEGTPEFERTLSAVAAVQQWANSRHSQVIVTGMSLGTGPAAYHAKLGGAEKLILVSPYDSIEHLASRYYPVFPVSLILRERFEPLVWAKEAQTPLTVLHGQKDIKIPPRYSEGYESLPENKRILIPGATHDNIVFADSFEDSFTEALRS